ncbi:hypothetical protein ACFQU2_33715 [Siccirubricoccus deserti]
MPGLEALRAQPRLRILTRTTAFHYGLQNYVSLAEVLDRPDGLRERLWRVRARRVVLATGALERLLPFSGNDRPGVMLADAARAYVARWAVLPGRRAVLLAAHDSGYDAAFALQDAGAGVVAILDLRAAPPAALRKQPPRAALRCARRMASPPPAAAPASPACWRHRSAPMAAPTPPARRPWPATWC